MGNQELSKLKEIALPESISYFPQTPAWYILFGIVIIFILFLLWKQYQHYKKNLYRKVALTELSKIKREKSYQTIPILLKRVALIFAKRDIIAPLSDKFWLEFLNKSYNGNGFTTDAGKLLVVLSYSSPHKISQYEPSEIEALFNLISEWIKKHNA